MIWQTLEFLLGVTDNIIIFMFAKALLPMRFKNILPLCLCTLICSVTVYILDAIYMPIKAVISLLQLTAAFYVLFKGKIYIKFAFAATSLYLLYIVDIAFGNTASIIFDEHILAVFYGNPATRFAVCIAIKALDVMAFYFVYKMFSKVDFDMPYKNWALYDVTVTVFTVIAVMFMTVYGQTDYSSYYSAMFMLISVIFFIMSLIVLYFFTEICSGFQKEKRLYILEQSNKSLENALGVQDRDNIKMRKLRHDLKNHIDNALMLINCGDKSGANELMSQVYERVNAIGKGLESCTGSSLIDSIIAYKKSVCESKNIRFDYVLEPLPELNIELSDLSSLLSNLLDNAIEAAEESSEPWVKVRVFTYKTYLTISMMNSCRGELKDLKTQKSDKNFHGFGISIIEDIAKKYNGTFSHKISGGVFTANVMVRC